MVPGGGARVQVREGHTVVYDVKSEQPIRLVHVAGTLTFARDKDTQLDVGLIKIQPGDDVSEDGFDCDAHLPSGPAHGPRPALEVGEDCAVNFSGEFRIFRKALFCNHDHATTGTAECFVGSSRNDVKAIIKRILGNTSHN